MPRRTAKALRPLDVTRLGIAAARPGNDPRTWIALARVEEVGWDAGLVVAVQVLEGALCGEDVVCELAGPLATAQGLGVCAIREGDHCVIGLLGGDGNNMPQILGFVPSPDTVPPATVNGEPITAELLAETHVLADPERALELELKTVRLVAGRVELGPTPAPSQPFVRGSAFVSALGSFLDATDTLANTSKVASTAASAACVGPIAPLKAFFDSFTAALTIWQVQIAALKAHLVEGDVLSTHITGE